MGENYGEGVCKTTEWRDVRLVEVFVLGRVEYMLRVDKGKLTNFKF